MNIYLSHSGSYDYQFELYGPIKSSETIMKHHVIFPHDGDNINSRDLIKHSDLLIAEVSLPSTGQGIELGWADMENIPILCIYKADSKPSSSIQFITSDFIEYKDVADLVSKLSDRLNSI